MPDNSLKVAGSVHTIVVLSYQCEYPYSRGTRSQLSVVVYGAPAGSFPAVQLIAALQASVP